MEFFYIHNVLCMRYYVVTKCINGFPFLSDNVFEFILRN